MGEKTKNQVTKIMETIENASKRVNPLGTLKIEEQNVWNKVQSEFSELKNDLKKFVEKIDQEKDEAKLQSHLALMNAKDRWEVLHETIEELSQNVLQKTQGSVDHAKLQAHLAKLESKEFFDSKTEEHMKKYHDIKGEVKDSWYQMLSQVDSGIWDIINKFPVK